MNYITIVTEAGLAALAAAAQAGGKVNITHMAIGDGNGAEYEPTEDQTSLKNEKWRGAVASYTRSGNSFTATAAMPAETAAFTIRELALFLADGTCFAVANAPSIPHQPPVNGAGTEFEAVMPFVVENAESVTVTVEPSGAVSQDMVGQPDGVAWLNEESFVPIEQGGTAAGTAQGARTNLEVAKPVRTTASFPTSGWTLSGSVYTQTVSCSVAKATMKYANIGPQYSTDASARKLEQEAYALIAYVDTADGQLVATCWGNEKPAVNLTLIFEGGAD